MPTLFHSVPGPYPDPTIDAQSKLFYIGINWERINGDRGRYHDLLTLLDEEGLIQIFGPEVFLGIKPWEGYKSYSGEIPFDGKSVIEKINAAGICLALSSAAHQRSGIMSNRLFEGLAAGAVIIANRHPFIEKYFSDCVYYIDDTVGSTELASSVRALVMHIRSHVAEARERAVRGQQRFLKRFTLEKCLHDIVHGHSSRLALYNERLVGPNAHETTIILEYAGLSFSVFRTMLDNVIQQTDVKIHLVVVCDTRLRLAYEKDINEFVAGYVVRVQFFDGTFCNILGDLEARSTRTAGTGAQITAALLSVETETFCFMQADDLWFHDHVASLCFALTQDDSASFCCSGRIAENRDNSRPAVRHVEELTLSHLHALIDGFFRRDVGRFVYRSSLIKDMPKPLMLLLDGFHHRWFNTMALLTGELAQTNVASYVHLRWRAASLPDGFYSEAEQGLFLRDAVKGKPAWIRLSAVLHQAQSPGMAPEEIVSAELVKLSLDHLYALQRDKDGIALLKTGFSPPEPDFTWVDGVTGILQFTLTQDQRPVELFLLAGGRALDEGKKQPTCTVLLNDVKLNSFNVEVGLEEYRFPLPAQIDREAIVTVTLSLDVAEQVLGANGKVIDPRKLGVKVASFGLMSVERPSDAGRLGYPVLRGTDAFKTRLKSAIKRRLRSSATRIFR
jgi:hypothetical protein